MLLHDKCVILLQNVKLQQNLMQEIITDAGQASEKPLFSWSKALKKFPVSLHLYLIAVSQILITHFYWEVIVELVSQNNYREITARMLFT